MEQCDGALLPRGWRGQRRHRFAWGSPSTSGSSATWLFPHQTQWGGSWALADRGWMQLGAGCRVLVLREEPRASGTACLGMCCATSSECLLKFL